MRLLLLVSLSAALLAQTPAKTESSDLDSLVSMVESKLPDSLILKQVQKSGKVYNLQPQDLVRLQKAGASEKLLEALMEGPAAPAAPAAPAVAPSQPATPAPLAPEARGAAEAPAAAAAAEAPAAPKKKSWLQLRMEQTGQRMVNNGKNSVDRSIDKTASSVENTADRATATADSKVNRTMDNARTSVDKKVNGTLGTPASGTSSTTTKQ
jgi:hypothetical protein